MLRYGKLILFYHVSYFQNSHKGKVAACYGWTDFLRKPLTKFVVSRAEFLSQSSPD